MKELQTLFEPVFKQLDRAWEYLHEMNLRLMDGREFSKHAETCEKCSAELDEVMKDDIRHDAERDMVDEEAASLGMVRDEDGRWVDPYKHD